MTKPLKNGHDKEAEPRVETLAARRMRRFRERKARGAVVLKSVVIEPDFLAALAANGWLHESEKGDTGAVEHALHALIMRALSAGVTPSQKTLIEVDPAAILDAASWLRPGVQLSQKTAGQALGTLSACAKMAGFGPAAYAQRLNEMVREVEARGIVSRQSTAQ
jgi:hypothetical protein